MKLEIPNKIIEAAKKAKFSNKAFHALETRYHGSNFESGHMSLDQIKELFVIVGKSPDLISDKQTKVLYNKLKNLISVSKLNTQTDPIPGKLDQLCEALLTFFKSVPKHYVFIDHYHDDNLIPFILTSCEYQRPSRDNPARVRISASAWCRGDQISNSITFYRQDLWDNKHLPVARLLEKHDWFPANKELLEDYKKELDVYNQLFSQTGEQFLGSGKGLSYKGTDEEGHEWGRGGSFLMNKDSEKTKLIMDDEFNITDKDNNMIRYSLYEVGDDDVDYDALEDDEDDLSDEERKNLASDKEVNMDDRELPDQIQLPTSPYCVLFDVKQHSYVKAHVSNLEPYVYDSSLADKLVLTEERKELISVLLENSKAKMDDIVKGKSGGTIIICSGSPGTGKTLTAECYSETAQRPLYVVQCSQLGTDSDDLEKHLVLVLNRAIRWNAILLIDEADVYIHERGNDINQNAIVGVFLRLLEYFSGVLFLTTNRATVVDDAIMSRAMAHVKYELPDKNMQVKLWQILSAQFGVTISPPLLADLVKTFPSISGRTIKQLLKLSKVMAASRNKPLSIEMFKWVSQFQEIEK